MRTPCLESTQPIFEKPWPKYDRTVSTYVQYGTVQGHIIEFPDFTMHRFLGIPYAKPPVGELRFAVRNCSLPTLQLREIVLQKPEKPVPTRDEIGRPLLATDYKPACIQFMDYHMNDAFSCKRMRAQSEDCLYLNVFAPGGVSCSLMIISS